MHILALVNLFFSGILAGMEIAVHYGFHGPSLALDDKPQIQLRQALVRKLRWLVPGFFVPTAITAIVLVLMIENRTAFIFRIAALLAMGIWIYVRIVATVKINSSSVDWDPENPPKDWKSQIAKAERFHVVGTWVATLDFIFFLMAMGVN